MESSTCSCENEKYFASIIDDSVLTCDDIVDAKAKAKDKKTKTALTKFTEEIQPVKHKISIFYLPFY